MGLQKACQGDPSSAPVLLLLHLSNLDHPQEQGPQPQWQDALRDRFRLQRSTGWESQRAYRRIGAGKTCQGDYGSTSKLLLICLSNLDNLIYSEDFTQEILRPIRFGGSTHSLETIWSQVGRRESLKTNGWFPLDKLEEVVLQWLDKLSEKPRAEKCDMNLSTPPLIDLGREENVLNKIGKLKAPLPLGEQQLDLC